MGIHGSSTDVRIPHGLSVRVFVDDQVTRGIHASSTDYTYTP